MAPRLNNDWLISAVHYMKHGGGCPDINVYAAESFKEAIASITAYQGTKIVVPFPDCVDLDLPNYAEFFERTVKRALCLAETVIIVPAPAFGYCTRWKPPIEFTYISSGWATGDGRYAWINGSLREVLTSTLIKSPILAESGAITFFPLVSEWPGRWSQSELDLPELPYPIRLEHYSEDREDKRRLVMTATCALLSERLLAERFGAAHLNSLSFRYSAINDMALNYGPGGGFRHCSLPLRMPIIDELSLDDLVAVRNEVSEHFATFSNAILGKVRSSEDTIFNLDDEVQLLEQSVRNALEPYVEQVRELQKRSLALTGKIAVKAVTFVLGVTGHFGSMSAAASFLSGGGAAWDLADMISVSRKTRLQRRSNSLFSIAEKIGKLRES